MATGISEVESTDEKVHVCTPAAASGDHYSPISGSWPNLIRYHLRRWVITGERTVARGQQRRYCQGMDYRR